MSITARPRRALATFAAAAFLVAAGLAGASAASAAPPPPVRMAAIGDSISQATMTCGALYICPSNSWTTGSAAAIQSHLLRLRPGSPSLVAYNDAVPGATSAGMLGQAQRAVAQGAQYVTVLVGANDACSKSVATMTPTATFTENVRAALTALSAGSAKPEIFVASIPNLKRMFELNRGSASARFAWSLFKPCDSLLASPTSTSAADNARRDAVQQRVNEYNAALATLCSQTAKCRWDGYAVANYLFVKADISTRDYFHPSTTGQKVLAAITWARTQWVS